MSNKPKNIIACVTTDLTFDQRMQRICSALQDAGYHVTLIGRQKKSSLPLDKKNYRQVRLKTPVEKGALFYAFYNFRLFFFLLFSPASILNSVDSDTLLACTLVSRIRGLPLIYDAHEYFVELPELQGRPAVQKIWEKITRWGTRHCNAAYTVGPALASILSQRYKLPFEVIRNLPIPRKIKPQKKKDQRILLYQGALNAGRGLEQLIQAMHHLPHLQLWLAGEGDLSDDLREKVKKENLQDRIRFLGYLKPEALQELTPQASIGLNLLENRGLNYYYSLANKAFDYIQAGIPAIHMDFPEYRALNQAFEVAILIPDLSEISLTVAIQRLTEDQEHYQKLADNCKRAAEYYHWENEKEQLVNIYKNL